jgi:hypothetical protein
VDKEYLKKILDYLNENKVPPFKCPECGKDAYEMRTKMVGDMEEIRMNFPCGCGHKQEGSLVLRKILPPANM